MNEPNRMKRDATRTGHRALGGTVGNVKSHAEHTGHRVSAALGLLGARPSGRPSFRPSPGSAAGIESALDVHTPPAPGAVRITCFDYGPEELTIRGLDRVEDLATLSRPAHASVRWLRVEGLHPFVINRLRSELAFHTLAAEDVMNPHQRPRAESYGDGELFVVTQLMTLHESQLSAEQISLFLLPGQVLSFHEHSSAVWEPIEKRLANPSSRLRQADASYLAYALLDTIVDHAFPVLDAYAQKLESLEDAILERPKPGLFSTVHSVKRQLQGLRGALWPTRELLAELSEQPHGLVSEQTRVYLGDVHDHCVQAVDLVETFREASSSLTDLYLSMSNHRMSEVMQILTVISTIFIPITFLAGVYGMNFPGIPELSWEHGYLAFWSASGVIILALLWYFRRRGFIG